MKVYICIANDKNENVKPGTVHFFVDKDKDREADYKAKMKDEKYPWVYFWINVPEPLYKLLPGVMRKGLEEQGYQIS